MSKTQNKKQPSKVASPSAASTGITSPLGFRAAGGTCGIKASGKPDLAIILADHPCSAAGMFTKNKMPGAPVIVCKRHIKSGLAQAIVCNSGCSNVCTGERGILDAVTMCKLLAEHAPLSDKASLKGNLVLPCSTGVIGRYLPMPKITAGIAALAPTVARGAVADAAAATAIMTTDLVPKSAQRQIKLNGKTVTLAGIAKGSGMIQPNLATMFAFITTDAAISPTALKAALKQAVTVTFNRLSVDMDTSTSDSVIVLASGDAGNKKIQSASPRGDFALFADALTDLCKDLAYQIVKDGEGATKVYRVVVKNAGSQKDADKVGYTVVGSPLIKCAVHGGDPNWGRLVMAVGRSGARVKPEKLTIHIGEVCVGRDGFAIEQPANLAKRVNELMAQTEITFTIDLGVGKSSTEWLGCDFSKEYVSINADYMT
jgi:glutamate N-acetyltransferase/amino-acid N-acetyltransferase